MSIEEKKLQENGEQGDVSAEEVVAEQDSGSVQEYDANDVQGFLENVCGFPSDVASAVTEQLGASSVAELEDLEVDDLTEIGVKKLNAKALIKRLKSNMAAPTGDGGHSLANTNQQGEAASGVSAKLLPTVKIGDAWLKAIERSNILVLGIDHYIAAIEAAIADRFDLFSVPGKVSEAMLDYSYQTDTPVGPSYYEIRRIITRRAYADLFATLDVRASDINDSRRRELIKRINDYVFPLVPQAIQELSEWYDCWAKMAGPQLVLAVQQMSNQDVSQRNLSSFPETGTLLSMSDSFVRAMNKALAGTGGMAALAMAAEANNIRNCLDNEQLPSLVGALNKDQMLVKLGIDLDPSIIRGEKAIVQFIIAFAKANEYATQENAGYYFIELCQLGNEIKCWDSLAQKESALMKSKGKKKSEQIEVVEEDDEPLLETGVVGQLNGERTTVGFETRALQVNAREQQI